MVEATGQVDYINTSIGVATASLFMIEASMHIPPGYALFIPSAIRKAVDLPVVGVGRFKDPLQAERALAEGHCDLVGVVRGQIADADFAAKARAGATDEIRLCLSCNQECVGRMGLNRWLGCIENPRTGREAACCTERSARSGRSVSAERRGRRARRRGRAGRAPGRDRRRPARAPRDRARAGGAGRRAGAAGGVGAQPGRARRHGPQPAHRVPPPRRDDRVRRRRRPSSSCRQRRPDHVIVATGAEPQRPWWVPGDVTNVLRRPRRARPAPPRPTGDVVVIDEIGFHHATSVAELLADRGCAVEIVTPGMVVGQDLGITLDMENWWIRADRQGHRAVHRPRADGLRRHHAARCSTTRPASNELRTPDWVVLAVPPAPAERLYLDLDAAGVSVERVGDCVAPRRAHAAVVEGERAGLRSGSGRTARPET